MADLNATAGQDTTDQNMATQNTTDQDTAAQDTTAQATTEPKRKRKTELERLKEATASNAATNSDEGEEDNPWTPRENLEILTIHEGHHKTGNLQQRADQLNEMMARIRTTAHAPQKPKRSAYDFNSQVRALKNDGVTIEDLRAECFPPPSKKKKRGPA